MTERPEDFFVTQDGLKIFYTHRECASSQSVLIFVHGLNEYVGRYGHVLDFFSKTHTVYFYDQRGHGFSEGSKAYVKKFSDYAEDLKIFINLVHQKEPKQKIFVIGHSMGGQVLLNYLGQEPKTPLAGAVFSSPNIKIHMKVSAVKKFIGTQLAEHTPKFRLPSEVSPQWLTHDEASVRAYKKDPMIPKYITAGLALELLHNQEHLMEVAGKISLPILMMHAGDDQISSKEATEEFFGKLASQDKQLKIYDGFYHELFNEIGKEKVFWDIEEWLSTVSATLSQQTP